MYLNKFSSDIGKSNPNMLLVLSFLREREMVKLTNLIGARNLHYSSWGENPGTTASNWAFWFSGCRWCWGELSGFILDVGRLLIWPCNVLSHARLVSTRTCVLIDGPIRANRFADWGAKNCESQVWGDSQFWLERHENRGFSAHRFARIAPIRVANRRAI